MSRRPAGSPIDHMPTPIALPAKVVRPGSRPLLHGFDVQGDLARHYAAGEIALVALSGEAPDARRGRRFSVAMAFAATVSVADAPVHAALLARRYGARDSGVASVAAIGLSELARFELDAMATLLGWLAAGSLVEPPRNVCATDDDERAAAERLREALAASAGGDDGIHHDLALLPAVVAVFFDCGLRERWQLEAALIWARLPFAIAEAMAHQRGDLKGYPINLPRFSLGE